jgi:hypothetical protein
MKKTFFFVMILFFVIGINAQTYKASLTFYSSNIMGDLTSSDLTNPDAVYIQYGIGAGLEFMTYEALDGHLGIGGRFNYVEYEKDADAYNDALKFRLGIKDGNYDTRKAYFHIESNFQAGISYLLAVSENVEVEPYVFLGFNVFTTPLESVIFYKDGITYNYRKNVNVYWGFSYAPGARVQWRTHERFGMNFFVEYHGVTHGSDTETTVTTTYNSFVKTSRERDYDYGAINVGVGVTYTFGD